jgi:acetyl esterase/lipase
VWLLAAVIQVMSCYKGEDLFPPSDHSVYDVPYAQGYEGEEFLTLDVHYPAQAHDLPVIVYIHGGGWTEGDKSQMTVWCQRMSGRGYVVFNVNYRLAPAYPFPAAVNDCLGALAWVRRHAREYGGDPARIGLTGGSAGAHLCALVATAAQDPFWKPTGFEEQSLAGVVKAQVPFFGVYDFHVPDVIHLAGLHKKFLGGTPAEIPQVYLLASPVSHVSANAPPTLLVCGKLDPLFHQSNLYYRALLAAGVHVEYATYPWQTHGFDWIMWLPASKDAFEKMMDFFDRYLRG